MTTDCLRLATDVQIQATNISGCKYLTLTTVRGGSPLHVWKLSLTAVGRTGVHRPVPKASQRQLALVANFACRPVAVFAARGLDAAKPTTEASRVDC
ncbi:MAG: hypothetical protein ABI330_18005 [Caldimonas sp.]